MSDSEEFEKAEAFGSDILKLCVDVGGVLTNFRMPDVLALALGGGTRVSAETIGPESVGNRALTTAVAPEVELPDLEGNPFRLSSLKGQKIVVFAWAPY